MAKNREKITLSIKFEHKEKSNTVLTVIMIIRIRIRIMCNFISPPENVVLLHQVQPKQTDSLQVSAVQQR